MALWMDSGSLPQTQSEIADLEGIQALKESAAIELKEKGNEFVKMGKKHYNDAVDCYTRAIDQKALSDSETSLLFSNRALVNLLLENYRRALNDAKISVKLSPTNVKALYRAAKAALSLNLLSEAYSFCESGLELDPDNKEIEKLAKQICSVRLEQEKHEAQVSKAIADAKDLVSAIDERGLKIGKAVYQKLTGLKKPVLDKNKILRWPVLLLYAEVMSSDFIEDFCEMETFSTHLDMVFAENSPPLSWDKENHYTREAIELFYEAGSGASLSKTRLYHQLLEGTAGANAEAIDDENKDEIQGSNHDNSKGNGRSKMVAVNEKRTLHDVLKGANFIIPGIPVFYVVSKTSGFYKEFKAGKWVPPS
jgi:tetratricopeptide (TPR) repeat protein